jgi:hypothetical protein
MEKVPSLRTSEGSAPKSYPNIKAKRTVNAAALYRAILVTFYTNVTFAMQNRILRKMIDYPVNNRVFDMKFSVPFIAILNSS